ncbi:MAG: hypothetical protein CMJ58_03455 [Planctomycetaceae bacterium]|nr:hypothetical protein [Planctomycetaceae bacterium]
METPPCGRAEGLATFSSDTDTLGDAIAETPRGPQGDAEASACSRNPRQHPGFRTEVVFVAMMSETVAAGRVAMSSNCNSSTPSHRLMAPSSGQ